MILDAQAQKERLRQASDSAGRRYNRIINLEVKNIKSNLHAINRDSEYVTELLKLANKAKKELSHFRTTHSSKESELKQLRKDAKVVIDKLLSLKTKTKNQNISWKVLRKNLGDATKASSDFYWFLKGLQDEERRQKGEYAKTDVDTGNTWSFYRALNDLSYFINDGVKTDLFSVPRMILRGEAGIGKTHLLCDYANNRINTGKPTLIFLSHEFTDTENTDPILCMATLMGYANRADFLKDLKSLVSSSSNRVCLIIDAVNEADSIKWSLLSELFSIKGLSLVISVRNGYEKLIPNSNKYSVVEHFGFSEMEWDAVSTFFKHYKMKMPEIPIINPEFRNPLFLMVFCEAYAGKTNKTFKGKGATHVLEQYVITQSEKIIKDLNIKLDKKYLWNNVIKEIGKWMGANSTPIILRPQLLRIIKTDTKLSNHAIKLIVLMEHYGLLLKYPKYAKNGKRNGSRYEFTYNRFSDHIIVRSLLTENVINSKESAERFFADGKFLNNNLHNTGLLEALSIQIPERCKKTEFVWVIPEKYRDYYSVKTAFLNGVKWRDVEIDGFDEETEELLYIDESQVKKYINTYLLGDFDEVMDCLFDVSVVPNHPLNALKIHEILSRANMAKRDSWFQSYMLNTADESGNAISRIQSWSISELPKDISDPKAVLLAGVALTWTLSSTDNNLRNRSTRALVQLFRHHQDVLIELLNMFIDTDDPYIAERLFAVVYGVVSLNPYNKNEFKLLVKWIYKNHFLNKKRRPDALMDDYAKGLIELYIRKYKNDVSVKLKKIAPPFSYYEFPDDIPNINSLKRKYNKKDNHDYYSIWGSLMYGEGGASIADFGNYTVGSDLRGFISTPLSEKLPDVPRKAFDKFKESLSKKQKVLLKEYDSKKFSNIRISFAILGDVGEEKVIDPKVSDDEVAEALNEFEKSLSILKKHKYRKYKSYITGKKTFNKVFEDYDINIARRWMIDRVMKLGWNPKLHGQYDKNRGSFDRTQNSGIERIGKKYQWISLYEFLAILGSNYYYNQDSWLDDAPVTFKGAYQTYTRDIDPTVDPLLMNEISNKEDDVWWKPQYSAWDTKNWQFSSEDIPKPAAIIESKHGNKNFITLLSWATWKSEKENPEDEDDRRYSELWVRTQGYIVYKKDLQTILDWGKDKRFYNETLPQPADGSNSVFLSEFPISSAYKETTAIYESKDGWVVPDEQASFKVMQPIIQYTGNSFEKDKTLSEAGIRVYSPSLGLRKLLNVHNTDVLGECESRDKKIRMFDPAINNRLGSSALLVNKDEFVKALNKKGLAVIWSVLGEKLYHNNGNYASERLEVQGICYLGDREKIIEDVRYEIN
ncbi:MAG TPA: NACHT domain-containing protein [Candidatus Saccharibacteria bacterium]|nr:NACHT domain-containing protein [Candidatus Saccharibacteria bacterium]